MRNRRGRRVRPDMAPGRDRAGVSGWLGLGLAVLIGGSALAQQDPKSAVENLRAEIQGYLQAVPEGDSKDAEKARRLLEQAERLGADGQHAQARDRLQEARQHAIQAVTSTRDKETVVYSQEFRTARDEYRYEHERHQTFTKLAQKVMDQDGVRGSMRSGLESARREAREMAERAANLAERGRWEDAIQMASRANKKLATWLTRLGLPISY